MESAHERVKDAYFSMAKKARYRPAAPGNGFGDVNLSDEQLADKGILDKEAEEYAIEFQKEEDSWKFNIGLSNFRTNRAFVYTIEAARALAGASDKLARELLVMAISDIDDAQGRRGRKAP